MVKRINITDIARTLILLALLLPAYTCLRGQRVVTGDERTELYLPLVSGKRVALFSNQTGLAGTENRHVLDLLVEKGVRMTAIFSPEHGFRGRADAGAAVEDDVDESRCREMSASYLQGYKYSRPVPIEQLRDYLPKAG